MAARSRTLGSKFRKSSWLMSPASSKLGQQATGSRALAGVEVLGGKSAGPWVLQKANKGSSQEPFNDNRPSYFIISLQEVVTWH